MGTLGCDVLVLDLNVLVSETYRLFSVEGTTNEEMSKARLKPIALTLLLSKLDFCWRWMTSSMRGCCHRPGVEGEGRGEA